MFSLFIIQNILTQNKSQIRKTVHYKNAPLYYPYRYKEGNFVDKCLNLANNMEKMLKQKGQTMTEFSEEIGISRTTLQSLKTRKSLTLHTAVQISDGLGIPLDLLINNENLTDAFNTAKIRMRCIERVAALPKEKQTEFLYHFTKCMEVLMDENNTEQSE